MTIKGYGGRMMAQRYLKGFFLVATIWAGVSSLEAPARAEGAICTTSKHAFRSEALDGWVSDSTAMKERGLCVVYYPAGGTFNNSPIIIYPHVVSDALSKFKEQNALEHFIEEDIEEFRQHSPNLKVRDAKIQIRAKGMRGIVKDFLGGPPPIEFERVAYLAAGEDVFVAVLSARKEADLEKYSADFSRFLGRIKAIKMEDLYSFAKGEADAHLKTEAGKKYEGEFIGSIGNLLANAVMGCSKGVKPEAAGFKGVFSISEDGTISDFILEKENVVGKCVRERLINVKGKSTPAGPWHVTLVMNVTA